MIVSTKILSKAYDNFSKFVKKYDNKPFTSFSESNFIEVCENYKYSAYETARQILGSESWNKRDIGTGNIQQKVGLAIQEKIYHIFSTKDNNLIDWRKRDSFNKMRVNKNLELLLFNFYKNEISDREAFESFIDKKLSYQFIAYLFFIKDRNKYMPISQRRFDKTFALIGLSEFKTAYNVSWDNYLTFSNIIKQVQRFLLSKGNKATLLDAHSFLWVLGNQMRNPNFIFRQNKSRSGRYGEDDDEEVFLEGKEAYELHRRKERNSKLVRQAKAKYFRKDPKLRCQVCKFSFIKSYGELGKGFIEAHHLVPIYGLTEETEIKIKDLAMVCSNCHRMLHRRRPWISKLYQLKIITTRP